MKANFFDGIVKILNNFLYQKPNKDNTYVSKEEKLKTRKYVSEILLDVLTEQTTVLKALSSFPKNSDDDSVNVCFHILAHFEADEDIRKKDDAFREEQDEFIAYVAKLLSDGEDIPSNIINEYNEYYKETLVYPIINKRTIIQRLKRSINL